MGIPTWSFLKDGLTGHRTKFNWKKKVSPRLELLKTEQELAGDQAILTL